MPFTVLRAQQAALLVILAITIVAHRTPLRRSSDPFLQGVFDANSSLAPFSVLFNPGLRSALVERIRIFCTS
jgi:hypothetical protein